jgi:hypothetical protein
LGFRVWGLGLGHDLPSPSPLHGLKAVWEESTHIRLCTVNTFMDAILHCEMYSSKGEMYSSKGKEDGLTFIRLLMDAARNEWQEPSQLDISLHVESGVQTTEAAIRNNHTIAPLSNIMHKLSTWLLNLFFGQQSTKKLIITYMYTSS